MEAREWIAKRLRDAAEKGLHRPMEAEERVEVLPIDREAAAAFVRWQREATGRWQRTDGGAIQFFVADFSRAILQGIWDEHSVVQAFAHHRTTAAAEARRAARSEAWQPIESAPPATGSEDDRIIIVGGHLTKPEVVLPDGDWWRMRKSQGGTVPTHWMRIPKPPAALTPSCR